jgi:hypothetical protein
MSALLLLQYLSMQTFQLWEWTNQLEPIESHEVDFCANTKQVPRFGLQEWLINLATFPIAVESTLVLK